MTPERFKALRQIARYLENQDLSEALDEIERLQGQLAGCEPQRGHPQAAGVSDD